MLKGGEGRVEEEEEGGNTLCEWDGVQLMRRGIGEEEGSTGWESSR